MRKLVNLTGGWFIMLFVVICSTIIACRPDKDKPDPCSQVKPLTAEFELYEIPDYNAYLQYMIRNQINTDDERRKEFVRAVCSTMRIPIINNFYGNILLEAKDPTATEYRWFIESDRGVAEFIGNPILLQFNSQARNEGTGERKITLITTRIRDSLCSNSITVQDTSPVRTITHISFKDIPLLGDYVATESPEGTFEFKIVKSNTAFAGFQEPALFGFPYRCSTGVAGFGTSSQGFFLNGDQAGTYEDPYNINRACEERRFVGGFYLKPDNTFEFIGACPNAYCGPIYPEIQFFTIKGYKK
jgi:hypothetical protein